ncbi:MAG: phytoene/squalene synthase family protein [Bacteroidetes bacterium]|nr:phytoene/squalene synthase family protein [Bacteroidota bacterium]
MSESFENTGTLDIMKKSKTNFFYSSLFMPGDRRDGLRTIYAYCRMTDDIADDVKSGTEEKKNNLKAWENKLDEAFEGKSSGGFFTELKRQIDRFGIPRKPFKDLIRGMQMDLEKKKIATFEDLYDYCYCVASSVGLMSIEIFGYQKECVKIYAEKLGVALQLTNIMRDIDADFSEGRIYIPAEEMEKFGYTEEDLKNRLYNDNFRKLMEFQYDRAMRYYKEAEENLPDEERKNMAPAVIMRCVYYKILQKIRRNGYNIFSEKIRISKLNKFLTALGIFLRYRF